ncbi:MAG: hypothetical protein M3406_04845 [Chloroflexota bacterium]|nr:hypothetical protein [Chloroflexota bacterium]
MRGLLALLIAVSACSAVEPPVEPAANHEVFLHVTNNRAEPLVIRVVPRLLQITGPPAPADTGQGQGEGSGVAGGAGRTLRLAMTTDDWTITVNGSAMIRSDEHDFIPGGWTAGRIVVDRDEATGEMERSQPAPSN